VILGQQGPVAINWKAAGLGPRLADFAWLMWGTWRNVDWINLAVGAYRKHVELTDAELDRLEAVMYIRPLYLFMRNPDASFDAEEIIVSRDRAVVRWVYRKMREGQPWHLRGVDLFTVRDGKVAAKLAYVKG